MKQLLTSFAFLTVLAAHAQVPFSQSLRKGTVLDTARYQVTYRLRYKHHPTEKDYMEDTRIVQIGRNFVKDYSEILFHFDSIRTDEERHGASNYSNASGNPWPVEIIYRLHQKEADIKYRLPPALYTTATPFPDWHGTSCPRVPTPSWNMNVYRQPLISADAPTRHGLPPDCHCRAVHTNSGDCRV